MRPVLATVVTVLTLVRTPKAREGRAMAAQRPTDSSSLGCAISRIHSRHARRQACSGDRFSTSSTMVVAKMERASTEHGVLPEPPLVVTATGLRRNQATWINALVPSQIVTRNIAAGKQET